jgi:hypothetical protein
MMEVRYAHSPSTDNYYVGKGKISFKAVGEATFRDIGNVSSLETTPEVTTLEHFSSREGVKKKDKDVVTEKKMTVTMVMDEWTAENLSMALLGDVSVDVDGNKVIDIFSRNSFEGELKYEGTNEIGAQMDIDLFRVVFKPGKGLNPISDEWGNIEIEGEVLADNLGKFGTWTVREQAVVP